jgi:hypothetical protein
VVFEVVDGSIWGIVLGSGEYCDLCELLGIEEMVMTSKRKCENMLRVVN